MKRSHAMACQLRATKDQFDDTQSTYTALTNVAETAANAMIAEVLDWRVVAQDRPLELPN